ncbi:MarP family serine protease [Spelaeicoccus albus]|uniref:S1-C subfamily serine protease n=1 Tax=Spelaeicoccus albus TaxID=1280376 RepID=A0A7Z0D298_9MICO|nr:MarP family serine protease [Spelaeicoccus albus]NYI67542.1 S1-C subfamily serine protease [Spelaeicoccus albus]
MEFAGPVTDIALVIVGLLSLFAGWRRGALVGVLSLAGFFAGVWIGTLLVPIIVAWMSSNGWSLAEHRAIIALVVLLICALTLQSIGFTIGAAVRRRMGDGAVRGLDSLGGAAVSVITAALVVWLAAGFVRMSPFAVANSAADNSKIVAALDRAMPTEPQAVIGSVGQFMEQNGFPQVFSGQTETIRDTPAPAQGVSAAARDAARSVVKVLSQSPSCGHDSEGSGWVASGDRVVTNAHVVAGSRQVVVQSGGKNYPAAVVTFDPERDIAVLHVPGLSAPSLSVGRSLTAGDSAIVAGYPGNGRLKMTPARVRGTLIARGKDIYGSQTVIRNIYSLRGVVRSGNSGGPLLDADGDVVGVVFAKSTTDGDTGYALTMKEVTGALNESAGHTHGVSSGQCAAA